uniref:BUB1 N-terminal domain-containing protein n=1 Tax=Heterorhabditis bacteriophora TaxID=37862 RepID=A0A1I7WFN0_HETBA
MRTDFHEHLRSYIKDSCDWPVFIQLLSFCLNTAINKSTSFTPSELVFARWRSLWELAMDNNISHFEKAKEYYDTKQKTKPHSFEEGDEALGTLDCTFMGPLTIIKISDHNAVLEDDRGSARRERVERLKEL